MKNWALKEIEIAKHIERGDTPETEWDYGCACYDSAYKAFTSLLEDGHSGASMQITKNILNRLIDRKPLTPIEDTDDVWTSVSSNEYQCVRMSSLFKTVHEDGQVEYDDINRCLCVDIHSGACFTNGLVRRIINELYPITMPYMPTNNIEVSIEEFLTYPENGDFDTIGIYTAKVNGEVIKINRFFIEAHNYPDRTETYQGWCEITKAEFEISRKISDFYCSPSEETIEKLTRYYSS